MRRGEAESERMAHTKYDVQRQRAECVRPHSCLRRWANYGNHGNVGQVGILLSRARKGSTRSALQEAPECAPGLKQRGARLSVQRADSCRKAAEELSPC